MKLHWTMHYSFKPLLFLTAMALISSLAMGQKVMFQEKVYYKSNKYELSAEGKKALAKLKDSLATDSSCILVINGHADNEGSPEYNLKLSSKRAEGVKEYLVQKGVPASTITVNFYGETQPVGDNTSRDGKKMNRRVEIMVSASKPEVPVITSTIKDFYGKTVAGVQTFCINPTRDTLLKCEQGTLVYVKANSFALKDVKPGNCVTLEVKEFFNKSAMVTENLSSTSNGDLMTSQGMVYTNATDWNGNKTELAAGQKMVIMLPADTLSVARLFYGDRSGDDNIMNWAQASDDKLATFTGQQLRECWNCLQQAPPACNHCKFLFCRMGRVGLAMKGLFNKPQHIANVEFRACQRALRSWKNNPCEGSWAKCGSIYELLFQYDIINVEDLKIAVRDANSRGNKLTLEQMKYYMFKVNKLGWANAGGLTVKNKTVEMQVNMTQTPEVDCRVVFRNPMSIQPGTRTAAGFTFSNVPEGNSAWVVAIKYANDKSYFFMKEVTTDSTPVEVAFQPMSIEDIKKELLKLNMDQDMNSASK